VKSWEVSNPEGIYAERHKKRKKNYEKLRD